MRHCDTLQRTPTAHWGHAKGHTAKEQNKQGYIRIQRRGTRRPPSQAVAGPGCTSSIRAGHIEEGWPGGGTHEPPQPPILSTTSTVSVMI